MSKSGMEEQFKKVDEAQQALREQIKQERVAYEHYQRMHKESDKLHELVKTEIMELRRLCEREWNNVPFEKKRQGYLPSWPIYRDKIQSLIRRT